MHVHIKDKLAFVTSSMQDIGFAISILEGNELFLKK